VLDDLVNCFSTVTRWIFELAAQFAWGLPDKYHAHLRRRQVPVGGSGRHVDAGQVRELMARVAFHPILALSMQAPFNALRMRMAIVSLQGRLTCGMTVLAARMRKHRRRRQERCAGCGIISHDGCCSLSR
jgi:hypothetical protein